MKFSGVIAPRKHSKFRQIYVGKSPSKIPYVTETDFCMTGRRKAKASSTLEIDAGCRKKFRALANQN